jgi:hypothetical protein
MNQEKNEAIEDPKKILTKTKATQQARFCWAVAVSFPQRSGCA